MRETHAHKQRPETVEVAEPSTQTVSAAPAAKVVSATKATPEERADTLEVWRLATRESELQEPETRESELQEQEMSPTLARLGMDEARAAEAARFEGLCCGRVVAQHRGLYRVTTAQGELLAEVSGRFRYESCAPADFPAVGDFVMLDRNTDDNGNAIIHHVLSRTSAFVRKQAGSVYEGQVVAANVDVVFACMALDGDFNLRRLERYLAMGWESGATPVVVLTKADTCLDLEGKVSEVESVAFGAEVVAISAFDESCPLGLERFLQPTRTVALIGSSGVGKSTLINRLAGRTLMDTGDVRSDGRGRHTTTHRELVALEGGALVIDTPGMREMGMWDVSEGLNRSFADVEALLGQCRFGDCRHEGEPGCAVLAALRDGSLSEDRWLSYCKLQSEAAFASDKSGYLAQKEKKFKGIAKANRVEATAAKRRGV